MMKEMKKETGLERFEMPACEFCYARCGICDYYSNEGWNGYCDYHRHRVSSTDPACGNYR